MGDLECLDATLSLLKLGSAIVSGFEQAKRAKGAYDFDDLIIKTGELLSEKPDAQWVLYKLDGGIDHMLVDEAQDTSPMQWQIVRALTDEFFAGAGRSGPKLRTLFVVGDRKQSIYSFQGADPNVFEIVHDDFKSSARGAEQEFRDVDFTVSFRSAPEILQAVDLVFARSSPARIGLDGLMSRDWHHESNRRDSKGTVEIWPLTVPEDKADQDPWQAPVDREPAHSPRRRLAKHIARTIKGWIGKRQLVSHGRPVAAGDVLILVQRRNSFFDAMIRALWNEQVPVAGADRLKLNENIAVLDLMALAQFALMPEDDHALACVLKSPVLARPLSEEELFEIAAHRGALSLWERLRKKTEQPYAAAASLLERLIAEAPSARPFEFLSGVLARARLRFASRLGSEANDAIDALLDAALDYEEANGTTLAGFVNWFSAGETEIKRNMEQGADEVRIMTVHGAKGLEAPIVILPDTTGVPDQKSDLLLMLEAGNGQAKVPLWPVPKLSASKMVRQFKDQHKDVRTHENQRLLYVAMTRARDELFVCGYAGEKAPADHCWYHTIANALKDKMTPLDGDAGWRDGRCAGARVGRGIILRRRCLPSRMAVGRGGGDVRRDRACAEAPPQRGPRGARHPDPQDPAADSGLGRDRARRDDRRRRETGGGGRGSGAGARGARRASDLHRALFRRRPLGSAADGAARGQEPGAAAHRPAGGQARRHPRGRLQDRPRGARDGGAVQSGVSFADGGLPAGPAPHPSRPAGAALPVVDGGAQADGSAGRPPRQHGWRAGLMAGLDPKGGASYVSLIRNGAICA